MKFSFFVPIFLSSDSEIFPRENYSLIIWSEDFVETVHMVNYRQSFPYLITRIVAHHKYSNEIHPRPEFRNYVT